MRIINPLKCLYCELAAKSKGLCSAHYMRWQLRKPMDKPINRSKKIPKCHPNNHYHSNGLCSTCYNRIYATKLRENPEFRHKHKLKQRDVRAALRKEFLSEYGNCCACCGETEPSFLTLEHKNKDGKEHRQKYWTPTQQLSDIKRRGWPKNDYEINCYNCNLGSKRGICPHKRKGINV